ncbi:MAG: hypothetical protein AAF195_03120 [Pseudomonadota bacterium]
MIRSLNLGTWKHVRSLVNSYTPVWLSNLLGPKNVGQQPNDEATNDNTKPFPKAPSKVESTTEPPENPSTKHGEINTKPTDQHDNSAKIMAALCQALGIKPGTGKFGMAIAHFGWKLNPTSPPGENFTTKCFEENSFNNKPRTRIYPLKDDIAGQITTARDIEKFLLDTDNNKPRIPKSSAFAIIKSVDGGPPILVVSKGGKHNMVVPNIKTIVEGHTDPGMTVLSIGEFVPMRKTTNHHDQYKLCAFANSGSFADYLKEHPQHGKTIFEQYIPSDDIPIFTFLEVSDFYALWKFKALYDKLTPEQKAECNDSELSLLPFLHKYGYDQYCQSRSMDTLGG